MHGLVLAGALFVLAPAAAAQRFVAVTGAPIAYQVSVPADWEVSTIDEALTVGNEEVLLIITTIDLLAGDDGTPLPIAEQQFRRRRIEQALASDSLLLDLASKHMVSNENRIIRNLTERIGTLGGQRAAYVRAHVETDSGARWLLKYVTIREGIQYGFGFVWEGEVREANDPLFVRIRESFVFPDARGVPRP